jgi:hypothetical protein
MKTLVSMSTQTLVFSDSTACLHAYTDLNSELFNNSNLLTIIGTMKTNLTKKLLNNVSGILHAHAF